MPTLIKLSILLVLSCLPIASQSAATSPPSPQPVNVHIGLFINDVTQINEPVETVEFEATLFLQWQDTRVASSVKNKVEYYADDAAADKLKTIWRPYIRLEDVRGEPIIESRLLSISKTGLVQYKKRIRVTVQTTINMRQFPFDKQKLTVSLKPFSKSYAPIKLIQLAEKEGIAKHAKIEEWSLLNYQFYLSQENGTPTYNMVVKYERKYGFYLTKFILPLFMLVILSWSVFWLPNEILVNRLKLFLTTLLTIVAFQWLILGSTPRVSYYVFYGSFVLFSFSIVAVAMLSLVFVHGVLNIKDRNKILRIEKRLRWLLPLFYLLGLLWLVFAFLY